MFLLISYQLLQGDTVGECFSSVSQIKMLSVSWDGDDCCLFTIYPKLESCSLLYVHFI